MPHHPCLKLSIVGSYILYYKNARAWLSESWLQVLLFIKGGEKVGRLKPPQPPRFRRP